jgi:hypothetical protein
MCSPVATVTHQMPLLRSNLMMRWGLFCTTQDVTRGQGQVQESSSNVRGSATHQGVVQIGV